eukprot:gene2515-4892_t
MLPYFRFRPVTYLYRSRFLLNGFSTTAPAVNEEAISAVPPRPKRKIAQALVKDPLNVNIAIEKVKELVWAKFDETVEIAVNLNVDPRKPNQSIKGVAALPHGTGKKVRVGVFTQGANRQLALDAGADVVGAEDLVARVQSGELPFDRVIATPDVMSLVSKIGKILGPRGLMPNPKLGTVTTDVVKAVKAAKAGSVQFRVEKHGIVQAGIGKVSFSKEALLENIRSLMVAIGDAKPEGFKGKFINTVHLSSTMGPGVPVEVSSADPTSPKFILQILTLQQLDAKENVSMSVRILVKNVEKVLNQGTMQPSTGGFTAQQKQPPMGSFLYSNNNLIWMTNLSTASSRQQQQDINSLQWMATAKQHQPPMSDYPQQPSITGQGYQQPPMDGLPPQQQHLPMGG